MASQAQINANRRNAAKSTGPRTPEGKAAVSKNALKHGLMANGGLLLGEDPQAFEDLHRLTVLTFHPETIVEESLVEQIVWTIWRLRRIPRIEAGRHIFRRYGLSINFIEYDENQFRARVAEAVDRQYGPGSEQAAARKVLRVPMISRNWPTIWLRTACLHRPGVRMRVSCRAIKQRSTLGYRLLFDLDKHRRPA